MEFSSQQRLFLAETCSYFHKYAEWPTFGQLGRLLDSKDIDALEIGRELQSFMVEGAYTPIFNWDPDRVIALSLPAMRESVSANIYPDIQEDLQAFFQALQVLIGKFTGGEDTPSLTAAELRDEFGMTNLALKKVLTLLAMSGINGSYGSAPEDANGDISWNLTAGPSLRSFRKVKSLEEFWTVRQQLMSSFSGAPQFNSDTPPRPGSLATAGQISGLSTPSGHSDQFNVGISGVARRDVVDLILNQKRSFHGRLDVIDFLERIWDLSAMPSTDSRFSSAREDIFQHYVEFSDWDAQQLLFDHLQILDCTDEVFLSFMEQVLHPETLADDRSRLALVNAINNLLRPEGYVLVKSGMIGTHPVFRSTEYTATGGSNPRQYDVALSYAGEDRDYVERVANFLIEHDVQVFYDQFEEANLWGKDLVEHLDNVYRGTARFCVMFISQHYAAKIWTTHERKSALAKAVEEREEYILPARFDDTKLPGVRDSISYVDLRRKTPEELGMLILKKLGYA